MLSVILPVKNIENEILGMLRSLRRQAEGIEAEWIIVDMGSSDSTVLEAVQFIKEEKLKGYVIQNGADDVAAALNTGIQRACGEYLTFIFARRLYQDFMLGYLDTAIKTDADFVFGSFNENSAKSAERRIIGSKVIKRYGGEYFLKEILKGNLKIDISAVLIRRKALLARQIHFHEGCIVGYAEEFLYRCLLCLKNIKQSPVLLKRNEVFELKRTRQYLIGRNVFQYVAAMLRIGDIVNTTYSSDKELQDLFFYQKLPATIMYGVDAMLKEGVPYPQIKECLKKLDYRKYLKTGKKTEKSLKRQVWIWKNTPWLYRT